MCHLIYLISICLLQSRQHEVFVASNILRKKNPHWRINTFRIIQKDSKTASSAKHESPVHQPVTRTASSKPKGSLNKKGFASIQYIPREPVDWVFLEGSCRGKEFSWESLLLLVLPRQHRKMFKARGCGGKGVLHISKVETTVRYLQHSIVGVSWFRSDKTTYCFTQSNHWNPLLNGVVTASFFNSLFFKGLGRCIYWWLLAMSARWNLHVERQSSSEYKNLGMAISERMVNLSSLVLS